MTVLRFQPIRGKAEEIINAILRTEEVVSLPAQAYTIHLVVEEIVLNVIDYAYPAGEENGYLEVRTDKVGKVFFIEFRDHGIPFNPLEQAAPDTDMPLEERKIGGLGIFLCKEMMDESSYRYENGENILSFKLYGSEKE